MAVVHGGEHIGGNAPTVNIEHATFQSPAHAQLFADRLAWRLAVR
jgi:hypothetical protein